MKKISLTLPDGSHLEFPQGTVGSDVVQKIGPRLAKDAIALKLNDEKIVDLMTPLEESAKIRVLTEKDPDALKVLRHSTAHIMSEAVQSLFPKAKVTIGPATETGFYYDYDYSSGFTPEDLTKIEKKMAEIISTKNTFHRTLIDKKEAIRKFKNMHEDYKVEIIQDIPDEKVSLYQQGEWMDLCRGPHLPHAGWVKAFKLLSIAGAYWRGDEKNKMLSRIYGTAFFSQKDLDDYLKQLEEAKKRDHRKLGKELDLFSFHDVAPASPFFHPKGTIVYHLLVDYIRNLYRSYHYQEVITPQILDVSLWHKSGHYENYKENMYFTEIDERQFAIKPMNCPSHTFIYSSQKRSYRDLPLRIADFGRLHRYERSGVLSGLTRVRTFCQDDAHIFCSLDQIESEIKNVIQMILKVYKLFGFDYTVSFSTRPSEKRVGSDAMWDQAENALKKVLDSLDDAYQLTPGEGAFYGPKIDFNIKDAIGRTWQCGTIQLDFSMPERFELGYTGSDGKEHRPVMIHRAILGSLERFMGILIEHYAGAFPTWLSPIQAIILNVTDNQATYCKNLYENLREKNIRVELDLRNEKLGYKIREAQLQKIPYMIVIGDKEVQSKMLAIRSRNGQDLGAMSMEDFVQQIKKEEV